jgi:hypothetical protein
LERKKFLISATLNTLIIVAFNTRNFGEEEVKRFAAGYFLFVLCLKRKRFFWNV